MRKPIQLFRMSMIVLCIVVVAAVPCQCVASATQCASFDFATGILNVPCFALWGNSYWLELSLLPNDTALLLQLTNFGSNTDCEDDDLQRGIYRGCNYFPLQTGNTWFYEAGDFVKTVTVSSDSHSFGTCTGKRISYMGEPCTEDDYFLTYSSRGLEFCGEYDRDDMRYSGAISGVILLPKEMRIGDTWSFPTTSGGTVQFQLLGTETLYVNGMTFSRTLKTKMEGISTRGSWANHIWYAKNVGMVKIQRIYETPAGHQGCAFVDLEHRLMELRNAYVNGISYP